LGHRQTNLHLAAAETDLKVGHYKGGVKAFSVEKCRRADI